MLKYFEDLQESFLIDKKFSHRKSNSKECVSRKVSCENLTEKISCTNSYEHIKQRLVSTTEDNRLWKKDSTHYGSISQKNDSTYNENLSLKNGRTYNEKDIGQKDELLAKSKKTLHKMSENKIKEKDRREFTTNINKLLDLEQFKNDLHDNLLGQR